MLNIRDLKYLIAIADYQHFGKAAEACFVSQPGLSMQIKKLEETLGVQLIERTNKYVLLTEVGQMIIEQARGVLSQVVTIQEIASQAKDPLSGTLRLGIIPTLGPYLLPYIAPQLSALFPKLSLYLVEDFTNNLLNKLTEGTLDAALLALPVSKDDFMFSTLFEEEFYLAISTQHVLAKKKIIHFSDLKDKTLLLLEEGHCLREQALNICYQTNASEAINFRATSLETLRCMVAANAGITLMPKLSCRKDDAVCYLPFAEPRPTRTIGLVWRVSTGKKILLENLVMQIKKLLLLL